MRIAEYSLLASRLLLAAVFLLAGTTKLIDPAGSRRALRDFGLPPAISRALLVLLPVLELAIAAALIPVALVWYGAWGALLLLSAFLIVMVMAMVRGRKPDCHCFGQLHSAPVGWRTLVRNGLLMACAGWYVARGQRQAGPSLWEWLGGLDDFERKVTLVAACFVAFFFFRLVARARPARQPIASPLSPITGNDESSEEFAAPPPSIATEQPAGPIGPLDLGLPIGTPLAPVAGNDARSEERAAPAPSIAIEEPAPPISPLDLGLPIGTPAPQFELPTLTGEKRSLQSLRAGGSEVLLIFSSPFCKPCEVLASNLIRWRREMKNLPNIVLVSRGAPRESLEKLKVFGISQVLIQRDSEVAHAYDCSTTPTAVLIGADGLIRSELVSGGMAIKQLLSSRVRHARPAPADTKAAQRASTFGI